MKFIFQPENQSMGCHHQVYCLRFDVSCLQLRNYNYNNMHIDYEVFIGENTYFLKTFCKDKSCQFYMDESYEIAKTFT